MEQYNGVLPLHKPRGMTSHDCVAIVRRLLKTRKVGHTGTLDPEVNGVLPICIGKATKIVQYVTDFPKEYEAEITLGKSTTTEDQTGETVEEVLVDKTFSKAQILDVLANFTGEITQIPPMYSAVKVNGRKLYEYARAGETVERPERTITIHNIELLDKKETFSGDPLSFSIRVSCSKGTYIRTLATDIGKALGFPAHMSSLVRTASGPFTLAETMTFEELEALLQAENENKGTFLIAIEEALAHFPKWVVNDKLAEKIQNGAVLEITEELPEKFAVFNESDKCLAIYQKHPTKSGLIKPEKVFS